MATKATYKLEDIPVSLLLEPWVLLRPVRRETVEYLELRDSLDRDGPLGSISARHSPRFPGKYETIAGNWRRTAVTELGWDTYPCIILHGITDERVLALQIIENAVGFETTPVEYSRQLKRIFDRRPDLTMAEVSRQVGKNPTWVKDKLSLLKLPKVVQQMVDRGEIPLQSAYMLAKLPHGARDEHVQNACMMSPKKFCALAAGLIKQWQEQIHQGKMDERYMPRFEPQAYLRNLTELKTELDAPQIGALVIAAEGCKTLTDAWNAALKWSLHLDKQSADEQIALSRTKYQRTVESEAHNDPLE